MFKTHNYIIHKTMSRAYLFAEYNTHRRLWKQITLAAQRFYMRVHLTCKRTIWTM